MKNKGTDWDTLSPAEKLALQEEAADREWEGVRDEAYEHFGRQVTELKTFLVNAFGPGVADAIAPKNVMPVPLLDRLTVVRRDIINLVVCTTGETRCQAQYILRNFDKACKRIRPHDDLGRRTIRDSVVKDMTTAIGSLDSTAMTTMAMAVFEHRIREHQRATARAGAGGDNPPSKPIANSGKGYMPR